MEVIIKDIENEVDKLQNEEEPDDIAIDLDDDIKLNERLELSPNSKLRNRIQRLQCKQQNTRTLPKSSQDSAIKKDIKRYDTFSIASKHVNILNWWKDHS